MKKNCYKLLLCVLAFCLIFCGCKKKEFSLLSYADELRLNVYQGQSESYKVKADYGYIVDENGEKKYELALMLLDIIDTNVSYNVQLSLNGKEYQKSFSFSPTKNILMAKIEVDEFNSSSLDISIKKASTKEDITLKSIVPENTIDFNTALDRLYEQQKTYLDSFIENDTFKGKLSVRIVVKDDKGYYYVGITDKNGNLKAMLIDGITGELLAIRDVF